MSVEYWAVPKKNFPGGLPDRMKKAQILDEELFEMEAASGASMTIDKSQYYILDKQIERVGLVKNASCIKFYNGSSVKCCISPNMEQQAMPAAARGSMDDSESQLVEMNSRTGMRKDTCMHLACICYIACKVWLSYFFVTYKLCKCSYPHTSRQGHLASLCSKKACVPK